MSVTSRCNGIWERHNRHNGLLRVPTCYGIVADWLRTCRSRCRLATGETGVMGFGLYRPFTKHAWVLHSVALRGLVAAERCRWITNRYNWSMDDIIKVSESSKSDKNCNHENTERHTDRDDTGDL